MDIRYLFVCAVGLMAASPVRVYAQNPTEEEAHKKVRYQIDYKCSVPKNNEVRLADGMTFVAIPSAPDSSIKLLTYEAEGVRDLHKNMLDNIPVAEFLVPTESPFTIHIVVDVAPVDFRKRLATSRFSSPLPEAVSVYLGPSESRFYTHAQELRIDPRSPRVAAIASTLKDRSPLATVQNILKWLGKNITYKIPDHFTVEEVLQRGYGECGAFSATFTALCRACGLPARDIWGLTQLDDGERHADQMAGHAWAEVYFPGVGWVPVEPQKPETLGFLPNTYVRMSEFPPKTSHFPWYANPGEYLCAVGSRHPTFKVLPKP